MDICTPMQFRNALMHPDMCFRYFAAAQFDPGTLTNSKYYSECEVRHYGKRIMLYAPISRYSMDMTKRAIGVLPKKSRCIGSLTLYSNEMLCTGLGNHRCSIVSEHLPEGTLLSEALYTFTRSHLLQGLEQLEHELKDIDMSVNNMHPDNIIVDRKYAWHVIRPYYASQGAGNDVDAFNKLRELIDRCSLADVVDGRVDEEYAPYGCCKDKNGHTVYEMCEGLHRFTSNMGTGFKDGEGNIVIEDIYHSATDFMEDRSVVQTFEYKMGIIDRSGKYILEPIYHNVEFNLDNGISRVVNKGHYALFDYFGKQISEWTPITDSK